MDTELHIKPFYPLKQTASQLGLSAAWLKDEADAGRVPCLRVGKRQMFDVEAVYKSLKARLEQSKAVANA